MPNRIDYLHPAPPFKVEISGGPQVYQWLNTQRNMHDGMPPINLPFKNDGDSLLPLGSLALRDTLLQGMLSVVNFSPEHQLFELKTILKTNGETNLQASLGKAIGQALRRGEFNMDDREGAMAIDLSNLSGQPSLRRVYGELYGKMVKAGYDIEYDDSSEDIRIFKQNKTGENEFDTNFAFAMHTNGPLNGGYCFHLNQPQEISENEFQAAFQEYGKLLGEVVDALYHTNGLASPTSKMVIAPPKNMDSIIKRAEEAGRVQKRMLARSGLLDPAVELDEIIRNKILVDARPDVTFDQIGGLQSVKQDLQLVVAGLVDPNVYLHRGTIPPRGIILYGPSGTGKTLLAKAVAHHSNAMFYNIELPNVLDSLLGKTEQLIAEVFDYANEHAPAIIFFDEIDALGAQRDNLNNFYSNIVTILLTKLRGLKKRGDNVIVIAATNRKDRLDESLMSPGRFDWKIEVGLPETAQERRDIFDIHMRAAAKVANGTFLFDEAFSVDQLARLTRGFSGAEIENVIQDALRQKAKNDYYGVHSGLVTTEDVIELIRKAHHK